MLEYVSQNKFEDRWIVIPYRTDLLEVLKRMDIYLGTYPQAGGLMAQYAAVAGLPIVEMDTKNGGVTEDILPNIGEGVITFDSWDTYYDQIDLLVENEPYRKNLAKRIKTANITEDEFCASIRNLLEQRNSNYSIVHRDINLDLRSERLLDAENNYLHRVPGIICNKMMLRYYPITAIKNFCKYILYNIFFG